MGQAASKDEPEQRIAWSCSDVMCCRGADLDLTAKKTQSNTQPSKEEKKTSVNRRRQDNGTIEYHANSKGSHKSHRVSEEELNSSDKRKMNIQCQRESEKGQILRSSVSGEQHLERMHN